MTPLFLWIGAAIALVYLWALWKVWARAKLPVHVHYELVRDADPAIPPGVVAALRAASGQLVAAGLRARGTVKNVRPAATVVATVHDAPDGGPIALVYHTLKRGVPSIEGVRVTIGTEFLNGRRHTSTNAMQNNPMRVDPVRTIARFPEILDPARCLRLHALMVERIGLRSRQLSLDEDPSAFVAERTDAEMARQQVLGVLRPAGDGESYRPTFMGAALMVWRMVPPSSTILQIIMTVRGRRLVAELEAG